MSMCNVCCITKKGIAPEVLVLSCKGSDGDVR